jgi:N-acyl-D-amino-acid deacylase
MDLDLVITGGTIVDGTGRPRFPADLGVQGGRIAALAVPGALAGRRTLDATGLAVAPGFVDIHSHSDWVLPLPDHDAILAPLAAQGVTTIVAGNCGFSPAPVTDASVALLARVMIGGETVVEGGALVPGPRRGAVLRR